jgi:Response regulator receiver domain.
MKGIIVDDDATIRLLLDKYCSTQDNLEIIQEFDNGVEAINF